MKNKIVFTWIFGIIFLLVISFGFAFHWPQKVEDATIFSSFFGQPRGSAFINSLIFENPAEVCAAEEGTVLIELASGIADMGWFETTLGNAIILSHKNEMLTVYGNLDEVTLQSDIEKVSNEMKLGTSGTSGWQKGKNCLEFQVIDIKSKNLINPFVLMPVLQNKTELSIKNLVAISSAGKTVPIANYSKINSGIYRLYIKKQVAGMTYRTSVLVNGAVAENLTFDILSQKDNRLVVKGKNSYSFEEIYPDAENQLLAEVILSKGKNIITVTIEDFFGNSKVATYTVEVI